MGAVTAATRGSSVDVRRSCHGLPPLLIQVGENEILYDDATRIRDSASAAGVLRGASKSWRYGIHVWPVFISAGLPESAAAIEHLATFLKMHAVREKGESDD